MIRQLALAALCSTNLCATEPAGELRVSEGFADPIGFYDASPSFSWKLPPGTVSQTAMRIVAASSPDRLPDAADLWDSGMVSSDRSVWVPYEGKPLGSRQVVHWQVKFRDQDGAESPWSEPARLEIGLLETSDWQGEWIRMRSDTTPGDSQVDEVAIESASYGVEGSPEQSVDLTGLLRKRLAGGTTDVTANNSLAGRDPAYGVEKTLTIVLTRNGEREELRIRENERYDLLTGKPAVEPEPYVPQHLRREFTLDHPVREARLHVSAKGLFEIHLNGSKVGGDFMVPGWTTHDKRIEAITYDVTDLLRTGSNAIGAILGEGWYAGRLGWGQHRAGRLKPQLIVQLEVTCDDGSRKIIASDGSWKATDGGPIRFSGIYDGETYDARREMPGWDEPGFDESSWVPVHHVKPGAGDRIVPKRHHPVRVERRLPSERVTEPAPGRFVFDLGQNIVGWPVLRIPVGKDQTITVRFAEMLEKDGTLYTANYRGAKSTDTYTAAADGTVTWHPTFTFHGFRYVELSGFPEGTKPEPSWVTGCALHSGFGWTGTFTSSHNLLNQLQGNITWGLRGNFLDVPTDCPQRDERLGWTGDAQVFAPAAVFNADVHPFFASWLETMRLDQGDDGGIPSVIPDILRDGCGGAGWADAATVIPWELYVRTGDPEMLEENFDMMRGLVAWYEKQAENGIVDTKAYCDWLQPYSANNDQKGDTARSLICTAYFARSTDLTARAARRLGKTTEAERLESLFGSVKQAFTAEFFDASGKLTTPVETQTGYLLALGFDLLPEDRREGAFSHLVRLLDDADGHLRTGFLGTPLLAPVLDRFGRGDLAYAALFKETYPSWFFSIHQGATTMWERWNSYSHADGFGDARMNSFNHYAYGAVGQWMYERIAGLAPDPMEPGYKHFFIQPLPGGPLDRAAAKLETPYGMARSAWRRDGEGIRLEATVPPNTTATLRLPGTARVTADGNPVELRRTDGLGTLGLKPGNHTFVVTGM